MQSFKICKKKKKIAVFPSSKFYEKNDEILIFLLRYFFPHIFQKQQSLIDWLIFHDINAEKYDLQIYGWETWTSVWSCSSNSSIKRPTLSLVHLLLLFFYFFFKIRQRNKNKKQKQAKREWERAEKRCNREKNVKEKKKETQIQIQIKIYIYIKCGNMNHEYKFSQFVDSTKKNRM